MFFWNSLVFSMIVYKWMYVFIFNIWFMSWVFLNITNGNISLLRPSVIFNTIKVSNVEHFENDVTIMFFAFLFFPVSFQLTVWIYFILYLWSHIILFFYTWTHILIYSCIQEIFSVFHCAESWEYWSKLIEFYYIRSMFNQVFAKKWKIHLCSAQRKAIWFIFSYNIFIWPQGHGWETFSLEVMFELKYKGCISIPRILNGKDITERRNSVCKYSMEGGSWKEHRKKGRFSRTIWHTHSDKKVDGVRIGDSGEEGSRDQKVRGYMCIQRNLS